MKNKIQELTIKYPKEIDLISLTALLSVEKTEDVENAINQLLKNLINKYSNDSAIKDLENFIYKKEVFSDFLIELKSQYPTDIDIISLMGINAMVESEDKSFAIDELLKKLKDKYSDNIKLTNIVGYSNGIILSGISISDNYRMYQGAMKHGYAGENVNNLYDNLTGKNAKIVGADNAKNGPDRLVDGNQIQTKFCSSGRTCINQCFDKNGNFKYVDSLGKPMNIEVPKDKYEEAIRVMREKIESGKIPNVSDPNKASEIVKQSPFTYNQAKNIAKFGTIESITFDAVEGVAIAGTAMGITAAISFAYSIWNGEEYEEALKSACVSGIKVGGITWVSNIAAKQMARTSIMKAGLKSGSDYIVKSMGSKTAAKIVNSLRVGSTPIYGGAALNSLSKMLRGNIVTGIATTVVLSSADVFRFFNGNVSGTQLGKNITKTGAGVAGGTAGWMGGAATGAAIGSTVPIIGTTVGGIIGGVAGAFLGGGAAQKAADIILDDWLEIKDDIEIMLEIVNKVFGELAFEYLLSQTEIEAVIKQLKNLDLKTKMMDMHASTNRENYARELLKELIENEMKHREKVDLPKTEDLLNEIKKMYQEEEENIIIDEMILVKGGKYKRFERQNEENVIDLYVSKYLVTQKKWCEINRAESISGNENNAKNYITWIEALKYCNQLSLLENLTPVYKIVNNKLEKIIYSNGEEVNPYPTEASSYPTSEIDFSLTNGYRLPTELEWEWFARGGNNALKRGTFDSKFAGSNDADEVALYDNNGTNIKVGLKKSNELGLHDCSGNLWEFCYDCSTFSGEKITKGGSSESTIGALDLTFMNFEFIGENESNSSTGLRVVRTAPGLPDVIYL